MKRSKFTESQIVFAIKQVETGTRLNEVCRKMGIITKNENEDIHTIKIYDEEPDLKLALTSVMLKTNYILIILRLLTCLVVALIILRLIVKLRVRR